MNIIKHGLIAFIILIGSSFNVSAEEIPVNIKLNCVSLEEMSDNIKKFELELVFTNQNSLSEKHTWVFARKNPNIYIVYIYSKSIIPGKDLWCPISYGNGFKLFDKDYP